MEHLLLSQVRHFRYERKFYITQISRQEVEGMIKTHPAIFTEIFHQRFVNNIYLDLPNLRHYFDNINGLSRRLKVRIRWYGELFGVAKNPMLELKIKHNLHIGKILYPLHDFTLDNNFSMPIIRSIFNQSSVSDLLKSYLKELNFSLLNRYSRKYYLSADRKYRITIDGDIQAYQLSSFSNSFLDKSRDLSGIVLELKYNKSEDQSAEDITNHFPFRISRSSKYVFGLEQLALRPGW